jgi:tryptophanase
MSGRDLAALTQGLIEGKEQNYLSSRIAQVEELGNGFRRLGFPIQWPPGSNGIYLDARGFLEDIDPIFFPAQRICTEIYLRYGIRPVEIGLSLAGRGHDGIKKIPLKDLVRFTIPRRVFSGDHINYILACLEQLHEGRENIGGLVYQQEGSGNGHFTSTFRPVARE